MQYYSLYFAIFIGAYCCEFDKIARKVRMIPVDDSIHNQARLLQEQKFYNNMTGSIRIYLDFRLDKYPRANSNLIRISEIGRAYWERTIELHRLLGLTYPTDTIYQPFGIPACQPPARIRQSTIANKDYGFMIEANQTIQGAARSFICAYLASNKRPCWSVIQFSTQYIDKIATAYQFQQSIYLALHEMTHCLGFAKDLYSTYARSSPILVTDTENNSFLNSTEIQREIRRQFECNNAPGMLLENLGLEGTDGSHWARKSIGNQYMTATIATSNPTISHLTLAVLESTGWYTRVSHELASFINFGRKSGCAMLDPNNCEPADYCDEIDLQGCDADNRAGSSCTNDDYNRKCPIMKPYGNLICTDTLYSSVARSHGNTGEKAAYNSKCYDSDLRGFGQRRPTINIRCYPTVCSDDETSLTLQIGNVKVRCRSPGQTLPVPGFSGTVTCPRNFEPICATISCPNFCKSNGLCIKGRCVCYPGFTGSECDQPVQDEAVKAAANNQFDYMYHDAKTTCLPGNYLTVFGDCDNCPEKCIKCNQNQCLVCEDNRLPLNGKC